MRKLRIIEHMSLDGVIQASDDDDDFPYGDWSAPYRSAAGRDAMLAAHGERFDLLLGRRTYDMWSGFWPQAPSSPMPDRLNAATKYVANPGTLIRTRHHDSNADRHHPQYLQGRRPVEDRIVRRRDTVRFRDARRCER